MITESIVWTLNAGAIVVVAYAMLRSIRFFFVSSTGLDVQRLQRHLRDLAHYIEAEDADGAKDSISRIREEGAAIAHVNSVFFGLGACLTSYFRLLLEADCKHETYARAGQILAKIADGVVGGDQDEIIRRLLRLLGQLYSVTLYRSESAPKESSPEIAKLTKRIGNTRIKDLKTNSALISALGDIKQLLSSLCLVENLIGLRSRLLLPALTLRNVTSYVERGSRRYPYVPLPFRRKLKYQVRELERFLILFRTARDEEVEALSLEAFLFPNREINRLFEKRREYERISIPVIPLST